MPAPLIFLDIAGPDARALARFYSRVFGWESDAEGKLIVPVVSSLSGAFREDPSEKRLYLGVEDVEATLHRVEEEGGTVDEPRFEVPGVVVLGLFRDPAGNPMGLVELEGDRPKVP